MNSECKSKNAVLKKHWKKDNETFFNNVFFYLVKLLFFLLQNKLSKFSRRSCRFLSFVSKLQSLFLWMILNLIISVFSIKSLWLSLKSFCLQNRNKLLFSSGFKFLHRPFQIKNITMKLLASFLIYRQGLTVFEKFSYSENWAKIIRVYFYILNRNQSTAGTQRLGPRTN